MDRPRMAGTHLRADGLNSTYMGPLVFLLDALRHRHIDTDTASSRSPAPAADVISMIRPWVDSYQGASSGEHEVMNWNFINILISSDITYR